jgi:hypothetical protein
MKRTTLKKFASLSAAGAGALAIGTDNAQAAAIVIDPTPDENVGFASGAVSSFIHYFGPGAAFGFFRGTSFSSTTQSNYVSAAGLNLVLNTNGSGYLRIVGNGAVFSGANNSYASIAYWHRHTSNSASSSTSHTGGLSPFSSEYALFRFLLNGQTHYGWIQLSLINPLSDEGPTVTIHRFAYEDQPDTLLESGDVQGAATVPEPSAFVMTGLGALALGAAGLRRWRKAKQAA